MAEEAARKGPPLRLCGPGSSDAGRSVSSGAAGFYNQRRATETPFYRLVAGHWDEFKRGYPEKYERDFGVWRGVVEDVVGKFLECGDLTHGFARVRCPDCRHEMFVALTWASHTAPLLSELTQRIDFSAGSGDGGSYIYSPMSFSLWAAKPSVPSARLRFTVPLWRPSL